MISSLSTIVPREHLSAIAREDQALSKDSMILAIKDEMHSQAIEKKFIVFYDEKDSFTEWMGNFYPVPVEYNNLQFANSESAFQAQKFIHHPDLMIQFTSLSGDQAFHKAKEFSLLVRPDWLEVKVQVMKEVIQAKIEKNPYIVEWLVATDQALLVEHNPVKGRDTFWSDDSDGTGVNMLGKLWMEIRAELRNKKNCTVVASI